MIDCKWRNGVRTSENLVILVVSGEEKWGAECIRQALSQNGFKTLACEVSDFQDALTRHDAALVVANLSGNLETDQGVCQKLVRLSTVPIVVIASSEDPEYTLALFAAGVDEVLVRPIHTPLLIARIHSLFRRYGFQEGFCPAVHSSDDGSGFQRESNDRSLFRFFLENKLMSNYLNKWARKLHR